MTRLVKSRRINSMEVNIYDAKAHLSSLIKQLEDEREEVIYISKNGKPIVQMTLIKSKATKRLGVAKKEMGGFDLSQEDFDSIEIDDFYGD